MRLDEKPEAMAAMEVKLGEGSRWEPKWELWVGTGAGEEKGRVSEEL